jgi:hypothetical protein
MAITFTNATRTDRATAINAAVGTSGQVRIYAGTAPQDANAALSSNTLLGVLACSSTFGVVANGVLTANAIAQANANNTGTASFGRLLKSDTTTVVMQFAVGTSGSDLNLNSIAIQVGGPIAVTSFVVTEA